MQTFTVPKNKLNLFLTAVDTNLSPSFSVKIDYIFQHESHYEVVILQHLSPYYLQILRDFEKKICDQDGLIVRALL